jgi:Protein of unknown function (DUF1569)
MAAGPQESYAQGGHEESVKTLADPIDKEEILQRMRLLGPESRRQWGRMTAAEMVCHLNDALRVGMGEKPARSVSNWFSRTVFKWAGLWFPTQWPHGVKTVPECDARVGGTKPAEMDADLNELRETFERYTRQPRGYDLQAHPIFGPMNEKEWMRWGYLHMDHHLRQFGA